MNNILAGIWTAIKAELPVLAPMAVNELDTVVIPKLQAMVASDVKSPDLQVVLNGLIGALKVIGDEELPKV